MGHFKTSISLIFSGSASGSLQLIYTVYKGENLRSTWTGGGPPKARYNRTSRGWFDELTFTDWFKSTFLPFAKQLEGRKLLPGDNLTSHISMEVIKLFEENNSVRFCVLPPS